MKVRLGFVSNSSSSSFLALIPKKVFESICNNLTPFEEALVRQLVIEYDIVFCSIPCCLYECRHGNHTFLDWINSEEVIKDAKVIAKSRGIAYNKNDEYHLSKVEEKIEQKMSDLEKAKDIMIYEMNY